LLEYAIWSILTNFLDNFENLSDICNFFQTVSFFFLLKNAEGQPKREPCFEFDFFWSVLEQLVVETIGNVDYDSQCQWLVTKLLMCSQLW
jgi:hypothetical protein